MSMKVDKISRWSEIKLKIIEQYAIPYMAIMRNKKFNAHYIDGFSGAGIHRSKKSGDIVKGSPLRVLAIPKPFDTYYFVDMESDKTEFLIELCKNDFSDRNVVVKKGDCSKNLMDILPNFSRENFDRLFCLLDPYGLHLDWKVIEKMGDMGIVDLIINFPIMDINRNAIRKNLAKTSQDGIERMNSFWGDETWQGIAYRDRKQQDLFDSSPKEKQTNETIAEEFRKRLKEKGKFAYVPKPIPLRNSKNAVVYYLYFASQNKTANKIATYLFKKYGKET